MRMLIWSGTFLLSVAWTFLSCIFVPDPVAGLILLFAGLSLLCALKWGSSPRDARRALRFQLIAILIGAAYVPFPYNLGLWVLGLSLAVRLLAKYIPWPTGLAAGLHVAGMVLMIQAAAFPFYFKFAPFFRDLSVVADPLCQILNSIGADCAAAGNILYLQGAKTVFPVSITIEKMAFFEWVNLSLAGIAAILLFKASPRLKIICIMLVSGLAYMAVRLVAVILVFAATGLVSLFWNPWIIAGSYMPLVLLWMRLIKLDRILRPFSATAPPQEKATLPRSNVVIVSGFALGIVCMVAAWGFNDPGIVKNGRILIDENHSDWEWTTPIYNTKWFGMRSGYNYYCLFEYLNYHYPIERNFGPIDSSLLSNHDVLIIKMPTSPFAKSEISAITQFVSQGGGLFLIGDHTNVFGTSTYINPIAGQFGLKFNDDATHDLRTGELSIYQPPAMLPHPVVQHFNRFLFGSSCSLVVPWSVEDVILGYGLKSLEADYSRKNFFSENIDTPAMAFGQFFQSAGVKYGRGRVLAFTDSTVFSNFWLHIPGKPELLLGAVDWLNRSNRFHQINKSTLLLLGLLLVASSCYPAWKKGFTHANWLNLICVAVLALVGASVLFKHLDRNNYAQPQPREEFVTVSFDLNHSAIFLPITELTGIQENFHTFYVWTQRLGYVPKAATDMDKVLKDADTILIINPDRPFSGKHKRLIVDFVERGGNILLMDSALNVKSTANDISQLFGMKLAPAETCAPVFADINGRKIQTSGNALKISGGAAVLDDQQRMPDSLDWKER